MKKVVLGAGLLVLTFGTALSLSKGGDLSASEEAATSESSQVGMEKVKEENSTSSSLTEIVESSESTEKEIREEEAPVPEKAPIVTVEESSESKETEESTESSSNAVESSSASESTTPSEAETSSSSMETTQSSSEKQPPLTTESTSQAPTEPSTEPTKEPEKAGEKPAPTVPENKEESQSASESEGSSNATPSIDYSEQPSVLSNDSSIPTIGSSDPLGEHDVALDKELEVLELAESDFNGYELPLLSTFSDKNQAILVYEGLRQLGEKETDYTAQTLTTDLYKQLFDRSMDDSSAESIKETEFLPGDVIQTKDGIIGLYLSEDYYLTVKEKQKNSKEENEEEENKEENKEEQTEKKHEVVVARLSELDEKEALTGQRFTNLTKTEHAEDVEKSYPASFEISSNEQTKKFVEQIGKEAQKLGLKYDVFASVMIAQAILESGSGTSGLSVAPNYNLFGVKGSYEGQSVSMATQEDRGNGELYTISAAFRRYPSYGESLGDYVTLIRGGISGNDGYYKEAWRSEAKNYLRAASSLTGKYATDTSYHKKISSIIAVYHLTQYDEKLPESSEKATGGTTSSGIFLQGKDTIPEEYRKKMTLPDYNGKNYNRSGSYPVGQCTWYAFNRVAQLGGKVDDYMGNGGEWGVKGRRLGYEVTQTPKVGYVISFTPGTAGSDPRYGHVAIVEAITDNGILISEGNVVGGLVISYRIIPNELAKSDLVSYIKPK